MLLPTTGADPGLEIGNPRKLIGVDHRNLSTKAGICMLLRARNFVLAALKLNRITPCIASQ